MIQVTVLGCGPAGLLAAQGAKDAGAQVTIVSNKVKSRISGAQFIHLEIPDLGVEESEVHIIKRGTAENYAKKVYDDPAHMTSWENYANGEIIPAWSMADVYDALWDIWETKIVGQTITDGTIKWIENGTSDMLISSIPAPTLCLHPDEHRFAANEVAITTGECAASRNSIIYNGDGRVPWFRSSFLFGACSMEFGTHPRKRATKGPPLDARVVIKPQGNDCDCRQQWRRVGRYGKWQRGILAHGAYFEVNSVLSPMH